MNAIIYIYKCIFINNILNIDEMSSHPLYDQLSTHYYTLLTRYSVRADWRLLCPETHNSIVVPQNGKTANLFLN